MLERLAASIARLTPRPVRQSRLTRKVASLLFGRRGHRVVEVAQGPLQGTRLALDLGSEKAFWIGVHEPDVQEMLVQLSRPGRLAFDIGANIGFFSLLLARASGGPVVAVEPLASNAERIRAHARLNAADVTVVEAVAARQNGAVDFELGPTGAMGHIADIDGPRWNQPGPGVRVRIAAVTLDDLVKRYGAPALVKIDVEGAEAEVLRGAPGLMAAHPAIVCEVHGPTQRDEVDALLRSNGYGVQPLGTDYLVAVHA